MWLNIYLFSALLLSTRRHGAFGQQFPNLTVPHEYPRLSQACAEGLNTTLKDCKQLLLDASVDMPRFNRAQLETLCTDECRSSLAETRKVIDTSCGLDTDVIEIDTLVWPATYIIDRLLYAFDISCRRDSLTDEFCDEIYLESLRNGTSVDSCSDCMLGVVQDTLNSPFGYHAELASGFESVSSSCKATGYSFTSPSPYIISTKPYPRPTDDPTCAEPYIVKANDTCDSIAEDLGIPTFAIIQAGSTDPKCSNLQEGDSLCLPEKCTLHRVEYDDTCESILASVEGLSSSNLLIWNPNINVLCTKMNALVGEFICVGPPGGGSPTSITATPTPTSDPDIPASRPTNAKEESNSRCGRWYTIQVTDYCESISIRESIALRDFYFLNPSIDTDCTNLWLETAYCVQEVGDINTYTSYPWSTSPLYTLTSSSYVTTSDSVETVEPIVTPLPKLELAEGTLTEEDGCVAFVNHVVVSPREDQWQQPNLPVLTENVNDCDFVLATFDIGKNEFFDWNPSLEGLEPCRVQTGLKYCAMNSTDTPDPPTNSKCLDIDEPFPGTIESCSCFTSILGYDSELYLCNDIASDFNVTIDNLMNWNSWIGSDCDTGLYTDLEDNDERPVCVGDGNSTSTPTTKPGTTPTPTAVNPAGPTQTGMVPGCLGYHLVVEGDGCPSIAEKYDISQESFVQWNPSVKSDCTNLWLGYAYCVKGPSDATGMAQQTSATESQGKVVNITLTSSRSV